MGCFLRKNIFIAYWNISVFISHIGVEIDFLVKGKTLNKRCTAVVCVSVGYCYIVYRKHSVGDAYKLLHIKTCINNLILLAFINLCPAEAVCYFRIGCRFKVEVYLISHCFIQVGIHKYCKRSVVGSVFIVFCIHLYRLQRLTLNGVYIHCRLCFVLQALYLCYCTLTFKGHSKSLVVLFKHRFQPCQKLCCVEIFGISHTFSHNVIGLGKIYGNISSQKTFHS